MIFTISQNNYRGSNELLFLVLDGEIQCENDIFILAL